MAVGLKHRFTVTYVVVIFADHDYSLQFSKPCIAAFTIVSIRNPALNEEYDVDFTISDSLP